MISLDRSLGDMARVGRRDGTSVIYRSASSPIDRETSENKKRMYQEGLEDSVGLGVAEEFRESDVGSLEDDISHVRVLGKEGVSDWDRS